VLQELRNPTAELVAIGLAIYTLVAAALIATMVRAESRCTGATATCQQVESYLNRIPGL
jgi:hypothetical protein